MQDITSKTRAAIRHIPITNAECARWARALDPESRRAIEGLFIALTLGVALWSILGLALYWLVR